MRLRIPLLDALPMLGLASVLMLGGSTFATAQDSLYAQDSDGDGLSDGFEDINDNGVIDGAEDGGPSIGGMAEDCLSTAGSDVCLGYFQFNCQFYGFTFACDMTRLGEMCDGDLTDGCKQFVSILAGNKSCFLGDQVACTWVAQQGLPRASLHQRTIARGAIASPREREWPAI